MMSNTGHVAVTTVAQLKILEHLRSKSRTWDELRALTKLNDDKLGFALGELLNRREIWTGQSEGVRVYGLERRRGLVARFANEQRRASDQHNSPK